MNNFFLLYTLWKERIIWIDYYWCDIINEKSRDTCTYIVTVSRWTSIDSEISKNLWIPFDWPDSLPRQTLRSAMTLSRQRSTTLRHATWRQDHVRDHWFTRSWPAEDSGQNKTRMPRPNPFSARPRSFHTINFLGINNFNIWNVGCFCEF